MNHLSLPLLARIAEDTQLEAKFLFPNDTEKQLRWCVAKGFLEYATQMAHFLRTAKDSDGDLIFPDIFDDKKETNDNTPNGCAKQLYASQTQLMEGFRKYEALLKAYSSTHELLEFINKIWPKPDGANEGILEKPKGITPPETTTVIIRPLNMDDIPAIKPNGKTYTYTLSAEKLRVKNFVSVPCGSGYKPVRINGITRRKIGYATESGSGEKYVRMHDVKPLVITTEHLTELLNFKLIDEYFYDGKNYYNNVYHEKVLGEKGDLTKYSMYGIDELKVLKFELFPEEGLRANVFFISDIKDPDNCFVRLEATTMVGKILHVYYPKYIHEVQNFIDFILSIKASHTQVYLERKRHSHPSDFK